jgi:dUTPase
MVVCPIQQVIIEEVNELSETNRGIGGFGSTGTK